LQEDAIISSNANPTLLNIGGRYFEGTIDHDTKSQGFLQISDLIPFEELGIIKRVNGYDGIEKRFVHSFVSNTGINTKNAK